MKKSKKKQSVPLRTATQFRYTDKEHRELVCKAAKKKGLSVNAWMVQATLDRARADLGK